MSQFRNIQKTGQSIISVGVVVPAYNAARYIERCISSIYLQTFLPKEVIVVDDGSTDETGSIVIKLQQQYPSLRYTLQSNSGQAVARNIGIQQTSTTFIAFCDADDLWYPQKLEQQIEQITNANIIGVYTDADIISEAAPGAKTAFSKLYGLPSGSVYRKLLFGNFICTSTMLVERKAFLEAGGFLKSPYVKYVEDYDLWLRIARQGQFAVVKIPLVAYQKNASGSSRATVRSAIASLRLLSRQRSSTLADALIIPLAILRQCLVVVMYAVKADLFLSPLGRVPASKNK